jgi:hypothetical protein
MGTTSKIVKGCFLGTIVLIFLAELVNLVSASYLYANKDTAEVLLFYPDADVVRKIAIVSMSTAIIFLLSTGLAFFGVFRRNQWALWIYFAINVAAIIVTIVFSAVYPADLSEDSDENKDATKKFMIIVSLAVGICEMILMLLNLILCIIVAIIVHRESRMPKALPYGKPGAGPYGYPTAKVPTAEPFGNQGQPHTEERF